MAEIIATISATLMPIISYNVGPFYFDNVLYIILLDSTDRSLIEVWRSVDGGVTWVEQDSTNKPNLPANGDSVSGFLDGTTLHIATQDTNFAVEYHSFSISSDTWVTTNESVSTVPDARRGVSITVRSDGDRIIVYNDERQNVKGTPYERISYALHEGVSWSIGNAVDDGGAVRYIGTTTIMGPSDLLHIAYVTELAGGDVLHKSLNSSNTLSSVETLSDTASDDSGRTLVMTASHYLDGSISRVTMSWVENAANKYPRASEVNDDGVPTAESLVESRQPENSGLQRLHALATDEDALTTYHVMVDAATSDLYLNKNVDAGGWTSEGEILDGTTGNALSATIFIRGFDVILGILLSDSFTIKYVEHYIRAIIPEPRLKNILQSPVYRM